jgi:flagellar biosynthesis/type III secretory pathway protein FliH
MYESPRDTPIYQKMTRWIDEEGFQKGLQLGLSKGLQQGFQAGFRMGLQEGLRQAVLDAVIARFPDLVRLANKQAAEVNETEILKNLLVKMSVAQSVEEARRYLLEVGTKHDL